MDALQRKQAEFVDAMMNEIGATVGWAMFNRGLAASMHREAASITTQISGEVIRFDKPGLLAMAVREPVGVILGIAPWNAPIILGVRAVAVALACGNAVILKASKLCPRTHGLIIEALAEAGFPEGTVYVVTNAPEDADLDEAVYDSWRSNKVRWTFHLTCRRGRAINVEFIRGNTSRYGVNRGRAVSKQLIYKQLKFHYCGYEPGGRRGRPSASNRARRAGPFGMYTEDMVYTFSGSHGFTTNAPAFGSRSAATKPAGP